MLAVGEVVWPEVAPATARSRIDRRRDRLTDLPARARACSIVPNRSPSGPGGHGDNQTLSDTASIDAMATAAVRSEWSMAWRRLRRNHAAMAGGVVLILFALCARLRRRDRAGRDHIKPDA